MLSQNFWYWDKQQSADSNIIQLHLTLKCTKDQSSRFYDCFLVWKWVFQHYAHCLAKFHAGSEHPLVCVVINNSSYSTVKNTNTAYHTTVYGKRSFLSKESDTLRSYRVYISPTM